MISYKYFYTSGHKGQEKCILSPCFLFILKAIEEGINHMWTVSAFQQHPRTLMICDENATLELKVKTVKYFKELWDVHSTLNKEATPVPDPHSNGATA